MHVATMRYSSITCMHVATMRYSCMHVATMRYFHDVEVVGGGDDVGVAFSPNYV